MKVIDANVLLGRWPFMPLEYDTIDGVLTLMDRAGIDRALVTSLNSVFYLDYKIGNRETGDACKQHPDRFVPLAVVNPNFPHWQEHLQQCLEEYGARGVKLHPDYHKYSLLEPKAAEVMAAAAGRSIPVYVQTSLWDLRHHPGYCFVMETGSAEVAQAVARYPSNTFVIAGAKHFSRRVQEIAGQASESSNWAVVTDGLGGPFDGIGSLARQLGTRRVLFGSRLPLLYAEAARDTVAQSELTEGERQQILEGNASALWGL
jgi:predicted TIM-barrel fold metal-dependent hydrolase